MREAPAGSVVPPAGRFLTDRLAPLVLFVPGFLLGVHVGGLLFFLNPSLPFRPMTVARASLVYGLLVGLAVGLVLLPFVRKRPRRALRFLPWALSAALGLAALLDSAHASYFGYYLPPGINERLVKASVGLAIAALITFYTSLLHSLRRRRYGIRSRFAFLLLALASVYMMVERREAFSPTPDRARPTGIVASSRPLLMVIGLDSASLDAILPMAEQGSLPFLGRVLRDGAYGRLSSFSPSRPGPTWTTVATGKFPYRHGVLGSRSYPADFLAEGAELRLIPVGLGFSYWGLPGLDGRPEEAALVRRSRTLWEVLPLLGVSSGAVGWPATRVGPGGMEFVFADRFFRLEGAPGPDRAAGRVPVEDAAWPVELAERARMFRVGVDELDPRHRSRFEEGAPEAVLSALAGDVWRQSLAGFLLGQEDSRAVFVRLPGLAEASSRFFGGYAQRRLAGRQGAALERASEILRAYYTELDGFLAETWAQTSGPRLLAVISAYGAEEPSAVERLVDRIRGSSPLAGHLEDGADGVILLLGEGIRSETLITGASLVDVAPTLLYGLGLPVARDLDGRVLAEVFERSFLESHPLTFVPSYETLEGIGRPEALAPASPDEAE